MRSSIPIYAAAAALLSCGGGSSGPTPGSATFQGTVRGNPVTMADATSAEIQPSSSARNGVVVVSSASAICASLGTGKEPKSSQHLIVAVAEFNGTTVTAPTGPGVFPIVFGPTSTRGAIATFVSTDATCQDPAAPNGAAATGGTITLTAVGATYSGSFDLTLDTTDHITGTFTAPGCNGLAAVLQSGNTTCQ
jgi:hypothetical protein